MYDGCLDDWTEADSLQYDYLMEAILAISGTHMSLLREDAECSSTALRHRQNAIKGLNNALLRWPPKADEAHAILATSYLLAFQSGYMADGFVDHVLSLRGCNLLTEAIENDHLKGPFSGFNEVQHIVVEPDPLHRPIVVDQDLLIGGFISLQNVGRLIQLPTTRPIEKELYSKLIEALVPLMVSPPRPAESLDDAMNNQQGSDPTSLEVIRTPDPICAATAMVGCFTILTTWPHDEVMHIISPKNTLGRILLSHFAAIRFMHTPTAPDVAEMKHLVKALIEWCEDIVGSVQDDERKKWTEYVRWPAAMFDGMRWCLNRKKDLTVAEINEVLLHNPKVFSGLRG